jgi:hypothetical protein
MCNHTFFKRTKTRAKTNSEFVNVGTIGHPYFSSIFNVGLDTINLMAVYQEIPKTSNKEYALDDILKEEFEIQKTSEQNTIKFIAGLGGDYDGNIHLGTLSKTNITVHRGGSKKKGGKTKWKRI